MVSKIKVGKPKPFIKWVGGKRQLLSEIIPRLPSGVESYFEPFVGGGALLWEVLSIDSITSVTISDYNKELINLYKVVKTSPLELIEHLKLHENTESYYYKLRGLDRLEGFDKLTEVERASRFLYLNKTGFNGLYRENSKGQINVPYGRYENPTIADEETVKACSSSLKGVKILNGDFESILPLIDEVSFLYLDPPYVPLNTTSFTGYTKKGFCSDSHIRLKQFCDEVSSRGGKFLLSNSSAPLVKDLYKDYNIEEVLARRSVNSDAAGRGKVKELLIKNY